MKGAGRAHGGRILADAQRRTWRPMMTGSNPVAVRSMAIAAAAIAMLALATMVSACGSGTHPTATAAAAPVAESACQQVGDALSDGPDPDADPVGYAEA